LRYTLHSKPKLANCPYVSDLLIQGFSHHCFLWQGAVVAIVTILCTSLRRSVVTTPLRVYDLYRGQVGTVVELLVPDVFEVEFSDNEGRTYASLALKVEQLLVLHHEPMETA